jgi:ABC-type amino acid transport substrate-binding protein
MRRLTALLLGASLLSGGANAAEPPEPVRLLLGTAAPWSYFDQSCQPAGIGVDLLLAMGRESGVPIQFTYVPYEQEQDALIDGRIDGDVNEINAWYDEHLLRIAPVLVLEEVLIGRPGTTADGASPLRIGHVSTHNSRRETLADMQAEIVEFDGYESLAAAYLAGEVDAVAGIKETLLFHLYRLGASPTILHTLRGLQTVNVWLYLSPRVERQQRAQLERVLLGTGIGKVMQQAKAMHLSAHRLREPRDPQSCLVPAQDD